MPKLLGLSSGNGEFEEGPRNCELDQGLSRRERSVGSSELQLIRALLLVLGAMVEAPRHGVWNLRVLVSAFFMVGLFLLEATMPRREIAAWLQSVVDKYAAD